MAYQALYRKYRPHRFADVAGQAHITAILANQVRAGRISHAYLFSGARGTGKTSTAKIFARAVNCLTPVDGDACGVCENCRAMEAETMDILEIDAASNNGVDDVRALIEQARFMPMQLKYKVYIVDEAHMLSSAASNALLKTLEEPPAHVLFLLATTEPQKLLPTVISRCQRFDFKRISVADILTTLKNVLHQIDAQIEEEGLLTIARAADGGMRDALSLMDQCIAFCGKHARTRDVNEVLGRMDDEFLFQMADALILSDAAGALRLLDGVVRGGRDLLVFTQELMQHMRAVLLAKECGDCADILDCTEEAMRRYRGQAERAGKERLIRAQEILTKAQNEMRWLGRPRVLIEAALVRICRPEDEGSILALLDRVQRLELMAQDAAAVPKAEAMPHGSAAPVQDTAPMQDASPAREDTPPWDDAPAQNAAPAPAAKPQKPAAAPSAQRPKEKAEDEAEDTGEKLWKAVLKALQAVNPALYVVAVGAQKAGYADGVLSVVFPSAKKTVYDMLMRPKNYAQVEAAAKAVDEQMHITLRLAGTASDDAQAKQLMELFGDKLKILE